MKSSGDRIRGMEAESFELSLPSMACARVLNLGMEETELKGVLVTFLIATPHLCKRTCLSVCPSIMQSGSQAVVPVHRLVPYYFRTTKIAVFEVGKTSEKD